MKRVAALLVVAAACTTPEYRFAQVDAGGPDIQGRDSGGVTNQDDADVVVIAPPPEDASADAFRSSDAGPLPVTVMANTGDINADCTNFNADMGSAVLLDIDGKKHCVMFFHSATWKRTWDEARVMCGTITRGAKQGRLAVFVDPIKPQKLVEATSVFPSTLAAWIGLELVGEQPTSKASWRWVTGDSQAYDGWVTNHPAGPARTCVSWAGSGASGASWIDVDCGTLKGVLCEMDE